MQNSRRDSINVRQVLRSKMMRSIVSKQKTGMKLVKMVNVARFKMFKGTHFKVSKHNQPVMDEVSNQDDDKVECKMQEDI